MLWTFHISSGHEPHACERASKLRAGMRCLLGTCPRSPAPMKCLRRPCHDTRSTARAQRQTPLWCYSKLPAVDARALQPRAWAPSPLVAAAVTTQRLPRAPAAAMAGPAVPVSSFGDAKLRAPGGEIVPASSLFKDQPVLFYLLRRPGCILCRANAKELWSLKGDLEGVSVRPVCVAHEDIKEEIAAFHTDEYWPGELYIDEEKALFKALGGGSIARGSLLSFLNPWSSVWARAAEAKKTVKESNLKGDGLTMGGIMVVHKSGGGVEYVYKEQSFGDMPAKDEVLAACKRAAAKPST